MKTGSVCGSFWRNIKRFGTAEKNENKEGKWCILTVFETIWYCRDHFETMTFSRFETILKTAMRKTAHVLTSSRGCEVGCPQSGNFENKDVDWRILTLFETIFWKYREYFENKEGKLCILSLFDTMGRPAAKILKYVKLNGAFWRFWRHMLDDI